ncbi:MAG: flagellar hook-length control protein FliK [Oscillospiraceae bacterium]|nr:flagellar hook-length control protein FliK [Oscillospiraceae bacterium]
MSLPMEFLSPVTTRTDSGAGVQTSARSRSEKIGARFDKIFEAELNRHDQKITDKKTIPKNAENQSFAKEGSPSANRALEKKDKLADEQGEALIAGVVGTEQKEVVFILEGDKESVANPEMRVDNIAGLSSDIDIEVNPETGTEPAGSAENTDIGTASRDTENANKAPSDITDPPQKEVHAKTAETAVEDKIKAELAAANEQAQTADAAGERAARMPEKRSEDGRENARNDRFSSRGNLSPLENENDKAHELGEESSAKSELAEAIKSKTDENQDKDEKANNDKTQSEIPQAPPLADGIRPEQFKAAQQMTKAAQDVPVKPENLFQEMISRVETLQTDAKTSMTIQLNPEFLGKVALEVAMDASGLHVKINAEDSNVRGMINGQLTTLIESLENKGIIVSEVEVAYGSTLGSAFKEQGDTGERADGRQQTKHRTITTRDNASYYTTLPNIMDYYLDTGISSVEYSA